VGFLPRRDAAEDGRLLSQPGKLRVVQPTEVGPESRRLLVGTPAWAASASTVSGLSPEMILSPIPAAAKPASVSRASARRKLGQPGRVGFRSPGECGRRATQQ
jgi:hypothetical protein